MTTMDSESRQLIGAWRLVDFSGDDYAMRTRGPKPTGMVIYDATGVMSLTASFSTACLKRWTWK